MRIKNGVQPKRLLQKLKEKKMKQLLPVLKAAVLGQKGPLVEGEIDRTKDYARELATKLKEASVIMNAIRNDAESKIMGGV